MRFTYGCCGGDLGSAVEAKPHLGGQLRDREGAALDLPCDVVAGHALGVVAAYRSPVCISDGSAHEHGPPLAAVVWDWSPRGREWSRVGHDRTHRPMVLCKLRHDEHVEIAELVLKFVQALVWPAATVTLVLGLRAPISKAIGRLSRLETMAGTAEFAEEARDVRDEAEEITATQGIDENNGEEGPVNNGPGAGATP